MNKIIPNGTEVLIFKYVRELGPYQDDENYIVGTIQSSEMSNDLSMHSSPFYVQVYEVLGQDGNKYIGTYGTGSIGNSFFRTKEDHIDILSKKISCNEQDILRLEEKNIEYNEQISLLKKELEKQRFEVLAVPCDRAFVVSKEMKKEFENIKPDYDLINKYNEFFERLHNIKVEPDNKGKVLIKTNKN